MRHQKINIKEFAELLGVSTATISRAYSTKGRISDKTRQRILDKAEEVGYRPNIHARSLSLQSSDTIAFFYPSLVKGEPDYFVSEIMLGISETASKLNLPLQIYPVTGPEESQMGFYKETILNGSISGIVVLYGDKSSEELIKTAKAGNIPFIAIGPLPRERRYLISYQIKHGAELAGRYFRNTNRKKPAFIGGINDKEKRQGFAEGLGIKEKDIILDEGGSIFKDGMTAFNRLHSRHPDIDSVFCANDILAIGFIRAALENGVRIPEDIAVIGCDDVKIARYYSPALTTIRFHEYELGEKATQVLKRIMDGEKNVYGETIECELIIRESA